MTGTDLMPSGAQQTFTGSNGATPSTTDITVALNQGSGGGISIQSNQMRIRTGTTAGNRTSVRITGVSVSDCELVFTWTVLSLSVAYSQVFLRANSAIDVGHGYMFSLEPTDMIVTRLNPPTTYAGPDLVTYTHGFTAGQVVRTRIALFGYRIRARTWLASNSEPTNAWQIDYTDPSGSGGFLTAGNIGLSVSSATTGSKDGFFDDVDLFDTITPSQATLAATGGITPAGALTKVITKKTAGTITPAGALTKSRAVPKFFTASITPAGALRKVAPKTFTSSLTPAGALARRTNKSFTGTLVPTATLRRITARRFTGAIVPSGVGAVMFVGRVFGRPGVVVMTLLHNAEVRIRHRRG